ncbi:CD1375 family protein [Brevibacillus choshinensis]|nr:CD1375 family protein [Brevibacillus choshinensis]
MVAIYVALIVAGRRTYESVPANLKPAVKEDLEALGLDTDGTPVA